LFQPLLERFFTGVPTFRLLLGYVLPRRASDLVETALTDMRVVLANGSRQSGKSTLAAAVSRQIGAPFLSLDRSTILATARHDPTGWSGTRFRRVA
jgi:MoxR-like ATPase